MVDKTKSIEKELRPIMEEFREKQTSFFAMQRLKYITDKLDRLRPEIEILNPQERATRMQPLEQQIDSQSISVKSLNVDYKLDRMKELEGEAVTLENSGRGVVQEMSQVKADVEAITRYCH